MERYYPHEWLMDDATWALWADTTDYQRAVYAEMWAWDQGQQETMSLSYRELKAFAIDGLYVRGMYDESYVQQILRTNHEARTREYEREDERRQRTEETHSTDV
jgi:hypothetical protein